MAGKSPRFQLAMPFQDSLTAIAMTKEEYAASLRVEEGVHGHQQYEEVAIEEEEYEEVEREEDLDAADSDYTSTPLPFQDSCLI